MLRLVVLSVVAAVVCGETTLVQQCTQNGGDLPINAYIAGCTTPPCGLPQLENAVVKLVFRAPRTMYSMTTVANAYLSLLGFPLDVPYPLRENALTCNFLDNSYCPVVEGEVLQYTLHMYIESTFPLGISPTIEFRIQDDNGDPFVCIRVPVTILPPSRHAPLNATLEVEAN